MPGTLYSQQIYQMCIKTAAMASDEIFQYICQKAILKHALEPGNGIIIEKDRSQKPPREVQEWINDPLPANPELHLYPLR